MKMKLTLLITLISPYVGLSKFNEYKVLQGHKHKNAYSSPLPHTYLKESDLPESFTWGNIQNVSYLTRTLNQHVPQYCGSCWAHGALSSFGDRIKIARKGKGGPDINLSIQYILNCGTEVAGSCHGGSATAVYDFITQVGSVPYETCLPYMACSAESDEGFCPYVDTTCSNINTCRTCNTFSEFGGQCTEIDEYPNATIAEYGELSLDVTAIKAEIFARGPVAAGIDAEPLLDYEGGVVRDDDIFDKMVNHIVSIVGWGVEKMDCCNETVPYWIVRNSWGEYWGEMGYCRVEMGKNTLGLESMISWATPGTWTETNFPCSEDGGNCADPIGYYEDPSQDIASIFRR